MSGLICSGDIRIVEVDADGVPSGNFLGLINTQKLLITVPDPDVKQRISKQNASYGQAVDSVNFPKPTELEMDIDDLGDANILAWALNGTASGVTQTAGTDAAASFTANANKWIQLPHRAVSAVVVTDTTGSNIYVEGTDYIVSPAAGFVKPIITSGGIKEGDSIKIGNAFDAFTGNDVAVGTKTQLQVAIDGDMINLATGKRVHVDVKKAKLSASGGLDLLGSDFLLSALKGTALVVGSNPPAKITPLD